MLALAMLPLATITVSAHVALLAATPVPNSTLGQPPTRIRLRFDQPPDPQFSQITVLDTNGKAVTGGNAARDTNNATTLEVVIGPLQPGLYTVAWQALAPDGHLTKGNYAFTLAAGGGRAAPSEPQPVDASISATQPGTPATATSDTPTLLAMLVHWWRYLSLGILIGALGLAVFVLRPAARTVANGDAHWQRMERRLHRWVFGGLIAFAFAHLATLLLQAASLTDVPVVHVPGDAVRRLAFDTVYGSVWRIVVALAFTLLVVMLIGSIPQRRIPRRPSALRLVASTQPVACIATEPGVSPALWSWWLSLIIALALVGALTFSSHAVESQHQPVLALLADAVHLGAMGLWLGGLVVLVANLRGWLRPLAGRARTALLDAIIRRFSTVGLVAVAALIVTGIYAMTLHTTRATILDSSYGRILLLKHALVLPLIGVAGINLLVLKPRLRKKWAREWLPYLITIEAVFGVLILLVTALLTQLPPAHPLIGTNAAAANPNLAAAPRPISPILGADADTSSGLQSTQTVRGDQVAAILMITTGRDGSALNANILDAATVPISGSPAPATGNTGPRQLTDVQRVTALITFTGADLGQSAVVLDGQEDGWYRARGVFFPIRGQWHITLVVRRNQVAEDAQLDFAYDSDPTRAVTSTPSTSATKPTTGFIWPRLLPNAYYGLLFALLGAAMLALTFRLRPRQSVGTRGMRGVRACCAVLALLGLVVFGYNSTDRTATSGLTNPTPNNAATLAVGQQVFTQNCATCHGAGGRGNGPLATQLQPRPADLASGHLAGHTDGDIYQWVTQGIPGTGMPAFSGTLSQEEIWSVIRYVRTLKGNAA